MCIIFVVIYLDLQIFILFEISLHLLKSDNDFCWDNDLLKDLYVISYDITNGVMDNSITSAIQYVFVSNGIMSEGYKKSRSITY